MTALPNISYRTPAPTRPVEPIDLPHPLVSPGLEGATILHVSDLHARRAMLETDRIRMILDALRATPADLIVLTGDLMDEPGHEHGALDLLAAMTHAWRPRFGVYSVFGNHDTPEFRRACIARFPNINWIGNQVVDANIRGEPLRLVGMDWPEDPLAIALQLHQPPSQAPLTIALAHHPTSLIGAASIGLPILLAGHTHAGQIRLHPRLAPHTSSDLPMHLASGMLRLSNTLCCISRGLGDGVIEGLRINCPRQIPLYTLKAAPLPGAARAAVQQVVAW